MTYFIVNLFARFQYVQIVSHMVLCIVAAIMTGYQLLVAVVMLLIIKDEQTALYRYNMQVGRP